MEKSEYENALIDIEEKIPLFSLIIDELMRPLSSSIDYEVSEIHGDDLAIAFNLKCNRPAIPIILVFWCDKPRFSLFLRDHEVSDRYLDAELDFLDLQNYLKLLLSSDVFYTIYKTAEGDVRKIIIKYHILYSNGNSVWVDSTVISKFSRFKKLTPEMIKYDSWL